ncbi:MAG TPA: ATP-dependent DNA helicase [Actinomycetes bacterium]|nr:ATP-dependent DNA helicase [Actinomycetes bacterium]
MKESASGEPRAWRLHRGFPATGGSTITLDSAQQDVVDLVGEPGHGPVLLLAGPGTGKTTTLVEAVAARVASGTDPDRILTLTFSRKAAGELRARIGATLGRTVAAPLAWTFHGFGYSLLAHTRAAGDVGRPLRLMSGPEQDVAVRELLTYDPNVGAVQWPTELLAALPTRGFTDEVRTFLSRARSLGLDATELRKVAAGRADWLATADFMAEYLDVMDGRGVVDYAELIARAVAYAESADGRDRLRKTYDLVVVDEYQDTDPAQERLLQAIGGSGRDLVVVGDPDQSIYAFRGAEVQGILSFPERFRRSDGGTAETRVLRRSRRCASTILQASRRVAEQLGGAGTPLVHQLREHRDLQTDADDRAGLVEVLTFPTPQAESATIADLLRREHLQANTPWADMAVLVRSGIENIPRLQRALSHAGVPVEVAGDEIPLVRQPALAPLLTALQVIDDRSTLTDDVARELLLSPLGGADVGGLRRLGRSLREHHRDSSIDDTGESGAPRSSGELIRRALLEPDRLRELPDRDTGPALRMARLLAEGKAIVEQGGRAHDVLWALWSGTPWPARLEAASFAGGTAGRAADNDLDAVVTLFELAARADDSVSTKDVASFLAEIRAQQIPADTLAERSARPTGVRLLTAHRSKGLEWSVVVVSGVQADEWPDVRRRGSLLGVDRLAVDGSQEPMSLAELRRDERRLFYVAITRAKRRLVVTAVDAPADDGIRPSQFLAELGVPAVSVEAPTLRPLTLTGLTAELRVVVTDPTESVPVRRAAAERLAVLAAAGRDDQPLIPAAHPDHWWGLRSLTSADVPVRSVDEALDLSGSALEKISRCSLQWFLSREVHADKSRGTALGFGGVVHAVADAVARGEVTDNLDDMLVPVDSVWDQLQFSAKWESTAEREAAAAALGRFVDWHRAGRGRTLVGSEQEFVANITVGGRIVRLRGRLDRVELDGAGRVVVVDLKTGRNAPTQHKVDENLQLATYQRAVAEQALPEVTGPPGGAELVQLRLPKSSRDPAVKVQSQPPYAELQPLLDRALQHAVHVIDSEQFYATPGEACSYCPFTSACPAQDEGRGVVQ